MSSNMDLGQRNGGFQRPGKFLALLDLWYGLYINFPSSARKQQPWPTRETQDVMVPHTGEDSAVVNSKDSKQSVSSKEDGERRLTAESVPRSGFKIWMDPLLNLRLRIPFLNLLPHPFLDLFLDHVAKSLPGELGGHPPPSHFVSFRRGSLRAADLVCLLLKPTQGISRPPCRPLPRALPKTAALPRPLLGDRVGQSRGMGTSHNELRAILQRHEGTIQRRWLTKTNP